MLYSLIFLISILAACSYNPNEETSKINVNCQIKDTVSLNEPINLNASLTYDDQPREEAEIIFEVWESGNKNNSKMLQAENLGDENYTHDYTFETAGINEIATHSNIKTSPTYDDQPREEAEIIFEVWESGNKNNSKKLQAENLGDGNYTHDYTFEKASIYEIAAHNNIKEIDPLPQKEIVVTQANTN